ncbi:hypothetical protein EBA01_20515 [Xanthomonas oryzae pv. oryzae]|nr:hypothetical protein BVV16_20635 [Xanthomonas oryzae pv. oryzae]AUI96314.1 hypothetical protein BVV17_20665 [Xanthomonas oryzae pv. oryzae]AUI99986.1 hypothetical protein BVV18_20665 [Xanthomonas oryzae pv. oryzae]AUJ03664.1 hypothetical protein BVV10_20630 [Xanthomonas oryzae pv. oryzae]AUJ07331.1 hypothetical protein BVV19_20710 [Xanthomonas oryzae pv. oryzae]
MNLGHYSLFCSIHPLLVEPERALCALALQANLLGSVIHLRVEQRYTPPQIALLGVVALILSL